MAYLLVSVPFGFFVFALLDSFVDFLLCPASPFVFLSPLTLCVFLFFSCHLFSYSVWLVRVPQIGPKPHGKSPTTILAAGMDSNQSPLVVF